VDLLDRLSLDVPVAQAGMGGGLAGSELAAAVASAGGMSACGMCTRSRDLLLKVNRTGALETEPLQGGGLPGSG
jgi:NAD(P)H-dependent flavin oxidoreductase YrpB (nitropropane dioxygenase family)